MWIWKKGKNKRECQDVIIKKNMRMELGNGKSGNGIHRKRKRYCKRKH